jgi:hypothetical protein
MSKTICYEWNGMMIHRFQPGARTCECGVKEVPMPDLKVSYRRSMVRRNPRKEKVEELASTLVLGAESEETILVEVLGQEEEGHAEDGIPTDPA